MIVFDDKTQLALPADGGLPLQGPSALTSLNPLSPCRVGSQIEDPAFILPKLWHCIAVAGACK
jgi:hypothetical protein